MVHRVRGTQGGKQMDVVGHQHVGVDRDAVLAGCREQVVDEAAAIVVVDEHRGAIVAALDDVKDGTRKPKSRLARHGASMGCGGRPVHHPNDSPPSTGAPALR
jgi:hypothetical protein